MKFKPTMIDGKRKRVSTTVTSKQWEGLKVYCTIHGTTVEEQMRKLISGFLHDNLFSALKEGGYVSPGKHN